MMKKIFLILMMNIQVFAFEAFKANVVETQHLLSNNKIKKYEVNYTKDALELTITYPELNAGEIYKYMDGYKVSYYPNLGQSIKQDLRKEEVSLFNILKEIEDIKESGKIGNKEYIYTAGVLSSIKGEDYTITFSKYIMDKPSIIEYTNDYGDNIIFEVDYLENN